MAKPKAYLAGPDVFLPDPHAAFERKKDLCQRAGLDGVSPLDKDIDAAGLSAEDKALAISRANEATMDHCDLIIANMTPFRGPSMDVGTAYEIGYMRGQGKPVFGYSNDPRAYFDRVRDFVDRTKPAHEPSVQQRANSGDYVDPDGMEVENFGLGDNLMLEGAVRATPSRVFTPTRPVADMYGDAGAFAIAANAAGNLMQSRAVAMQDEAQRKHLTDEWNACRQALAGFDKILVDLRRFGFTLVTILLSANGFLFVQTGIWDAAVVGIFIALLVLIAGLFRQDRAHEVFIRGAVLRALAIEAQLGGSLTYHIAYWSERGKTGTWGHLLYLSFCLADLMLAGAGLMSADMAAGKGLATSVANNLPELAICIAAWLIATGWILQQHRQSDELNAQFRAAVDHRAKAQGLKWLSET